VPIVGGVTVTFDTKSSSCPTLSTAFWLLIVATRGLESTCTLPWVSRKVTSAAKLLVEAARPTTAPADPVRSVAAAAARTVSGTVAGGGLGGVDALGTGVLDSNSVRGADNGRLTWPMATCWLKSAQLMPDWNWSESVTSMIF